MIKSIITIMLASGIILGCADMPLREVEQIYNDTRPCCTSLSDLDYKPFNREQSKRFSIDADSQYFEFEEGNSFLESFKLPDVKGGYKIKVKSYYQKGPYKSTSDNPRPYIFYPVVLLLDDDYRSIEKVKKNFSVKCTQAGGAICIDADIPINVNGESAKYAVIYTTPSLMSETTQYRETESIVVDYYPGGMSPLYRPARKEDIQHAPMGEIEIQVIE